MAIMVKKRRLRVTMVMALADLAEAYILPRTPQPLVADLPAPSEELADLVLTIPPGTDQVAMEAKAGSASRPIPSPGPPTPPHPLLGPRAAPPPPGRRLRTRSSASWPRVR